METAHELSANEVASAYFQSTVNEMEWAEVLSTVHDMVQEMLGDSPSLPLPPPPTPPSPLYFTSPLRHIPSPLPSPPPPPPTPPYSPPSHVPAWSGFNTHPQSVDSLNGGSAYDGSILLGAAPNMFEQPLTASAGVNAEQAPPVTYQAPVYDPNIMQSGHLYDQAYAYSQGQWPVNDAPIAVPASLPASFPAAPPPLHTYNNMPVLTLPEAVGQNLSPAGVLNGEVVYRYLPDTPTHSDPPPASTSGKRKCKRRKTTDDDRPYIKKPPNAFMLYRKEQRQNVIAEMGITDSAMINTILGQRWRSLSAEEKAKYFEEADKEKLLHSQRHPNWSSSDNYGKKKKRCRTKDRTSATASTSTSGEDTQVAKRQRTSAQTAVTEPSTSQTSATQSTMPVPLCYMCCLPQVYGPMCLPNSLPSTSTAIFPHVDPTGTQMVNHPVTDHRAT